MIEGDGKTSSDRNHLSAQIFTTGQRKIILSTKCQRIVGDKNRTNSSITYWF